MEDPPDKKARPNSGMRGRATRGGRNAAVDSSAAAADDAGADNDPPDDGESTPWKVELESIMAGTHPTLVEALEPHDAAMKKIVSQADRVRQLQLVNVNALFDFEKKQADDEQKVRGLARAPCPGRRTGPLASRLRARARCPRSSSRDMASTDSLVALSSCVQAALEFFKARLIDTIEEKQKKAAQQNGGRQNGDAKGKAGAAGEKRKLADHVSCLPSSYQLKAEELKADLEEINTNVDHYSVRSAAAASDELRAASSQDAWFDRSRQMLHCNGHSLERGSTVFVYLQGQRVDDTWTLTAMNAVEVTLRDAEGTKLKVTLAQLRNGRYVFRPAPTGSYL